MSEYTKSVYQSIAQELQKRHFPDISPDMIEDLHRGRTKTREKVSIWEHYAGELLREKLEQGFLHRVH